MSLPALREDGWLPEGHHETTWEEIVAAFGGGPGSPRAGVLARLLEWRDAARSKGLTGRIMLDGSFISRKPVPGDFDLIFVYDEATEALLNRDPEAQNLIDYSRCKEAGYGDVFSMSAVMVREHPAFCRTDLFDTDKSGRPKGVVEVSL